MRLTLPLATVLIIGCSPAAEHSIPIAPGEYRFQHRYAEDPALQSISLNVTIAGAHITVTNPVASDPFPAGVIAEGRLMWHSEAQQWIIGQKDADRSANDVGSCSGGPEIIDLASKTYWTC